MISKIKKNIIDLYKLKKQNELIVVEKFFKSFIKKNFYLGEKINHKYLYKNYKCACKKINKDSNFIKFDYFQYHKCECNSIFINPMLKKQGLDLIYSKEGPYSKYRKKFLESLSKKKIRSQIVNKRKALQIQNVVKKRNAKILDFGCGDGKFLFECRKLGYKKLYGVDAKYTKFFLKKNIIFSNSIKKLNVKKFDCITLWGVLEHLNDPISFSKYICKFLKRNGLLVIEVPNAESLLMNYLFNNYIKIYRFIEPARHLYFFSLNFLKLFAKKLALKIVDFETNGLDLQTIIGPTNNKKTKKILLLQNAIDELKISDHFRVAFKKL